MPDHRRTEFGYIIEAIQAARTVQEFLWGEHNPHWGLEEWRRMFRKRLAKIEDIDPTNPYWKIELKKRLLQTAALSIALLALLDEGTEVVPGVSNLPQYTKPGGA
jgi:hypothetical protein